MSDTDFPPKVPPPPEKTNSVDVPAQPGVFDLMLEALQKQEPLLSAIKMAVENVDQKTP